MWLDALGLVVLIALIVVVLFLTPGGSNDSGSSTQRVTASGAGSASSRPSTSSSPILTFDDLGGGSSIIDVYPGVKATAADRTQNGSFEAGAKVTAVCKITGRTIRSDPSAGETPKQSNIWVKIDGAPGKTQFATLTYADIDSSLLTELPTCADVQ